MMRPGLTAGESNFQEERVEGRKTQNPVSPAGATREQPLRRSIAADHSVPQLILTPNNSRNWTGGRMI